MKSAVYLIAIITILSIGAVVPVHASMMYYPPYSGAGYGGYTPNCLPYLPCTYQPYPYYLYNYSYYNPYYYNSYYYPYTNYYPSIYSYGYCPSGYHYYNNLCYPNSYYPYYPYYPYSYRYLQ